MNEQLASELALLREFGFTHLDVRGRTLCAPTDPDTGRGAQRAPAEDQKTLLADMAAVANDCEKCKLAKTRTNVV